jgi:hypothetical protein
LSFRRSTPKGIRKTTYKHGIKIPTGVENALEIDRSHTDTFCKDALAKKEMRTEVGVAFEVLEESMKAPVGWSKVTGHLVWDVKMDCTPKARWVLDGHKTPNPIGSTNAGAVSRDSIQISFTCAALNGLDAFAADIRNAFLQAPSSQKDQILCGPEFGIENVGKVALIGRALCQYQPLPVVGKCSCDEMTGFAPPSALSSLFDSNLTECYNQPLCPMSSLTK